MFTFDDVVIVSADAPAARVPGGTGWIVGVSQPEERSGDYAVQFPVGTVYTVEFDDGRTVQAE